MPRRRIGEKKYASTHLNSFIIIFIHEQYGEMAGDACGLFQFKNSAILYEGQMTTITLRQGSLPGAIFQAEQFMDATRIYFSAPQYGTSI